MSRFKYSVNTNSLRKTRSNREIVDLCKRLGVDGIEWGLPPVDEAGAAIKEMAKLTLDAGLDVAGYINGGKLWKEDEMQRWTDIVSSVGGQSLRVSHPWISCNYDEALHQRHSFGDIFKLARDGIPGLVELSKARGIRFVLEMHGGALTSSSMAAVRLFEGVDPKHIGVIYDPANGALEGGLRPRSDVEILGKYLAYVHAKNVMWAWTDEIDYAPVRRLIPKRLITMPQAGIVDYMEVFFALKMHRFSGYISSEEYFNAHTEERLRDGIAYLKECACLAPDKPQEPHTTFND
ncbi:MAG: sugar phosphate isomerase/epimerase [Kiritimatiellae bacterium]|nr:sugar phosphate isomerase/epimerase [Kiritimatiellia bacterium]